MEAPSPLEMIEMVGESVFSSARRGDLAAVKNFCLDSNFDPNVTENKDLLGVLHIAAKEGHLDVLAFFAQREGVNNFATDCLGRTPMHYAAMGRHAQAVFLLIEHGGIRLAEMGDADGTTALQIAAIAGEVETIRVLIQAGCNPNRPDHELLTPLHLAARAGQTASIVALLRMGADIDCLDIDCTTPLMLACAEGHAAAAECLLKEGAVATREDAFGRHALQMVVDGGNAVVASLLAERFTALRLLSVPHGSQAVFAALVAALPPGASLDCTGAEMGGACAAAVTEAGSSLAVLNLCGNAIMDEQEIVTSGLGARMRSLDLSHNELVGLPSGLGGLHSLVSLSASSNRLASLPDQLCSSLQVLDVSSNSIASMPASLPSSLPHLVCLALSQNALSSLPSLSPLSSLQILNLSHNTLSSLPALPPNLFSLDASHNSLSSLPDDFLSSSSCLTRLALEHNCLASLPVSIAASPLSLHPEGLTAHFNPLTLVPEPFRASPHSLMGYLSDLMSGVEQVLFIRVMLIGNAAAGKTSLLRCLSDNDLSLKSILRQPRLPDTGGATLGIQVERLEKSVRVCDASVRLQFWDFAGQACYMVGHSMFLSDRVLPVYVFDATQETIDIIEQANRWLDSVVLTTSSAIPSPAPAADGLRSPSPSLSPSAWASASQGGQPSTPRPKNPGGGAAEEKAGGEGGGGWDDAGEGEKEGAACAIVMIGTRVEQGRASREECADKMGWLEEALVSRVLKLYGRPLMVRGKFGVSSSTRECYDCRPRGSTQAFSFSGLLSRIGQSALGVLYNDKEYPRALVPTSYVRLRQALLEMPSAAPVMGMPELADLARRHAGITQHAHLVRALAMLRSWGALMHFYDSAALADRVFNMQWCIELIYTLFVCAHWRSEGGEGRVSMEGLRGKVDVEGLELADPGGRLLRRGILSSGAAHVMFGRVARRAGLASSEVCLEVLESMGMAYACSRANGMGVLGRGGTEKSRGQGEGGGEEEEGGGGGGEGGIYLVPSLFSNSMPLELKASLRAGKAAWTTQREYRFNILPLKLASRLTVQLCSAADMRSGGTSVSLWEDGAWVQMADGAVVMIDSHQGGRLLLVSTVQPAPRAGGGGEAEEGGGGETEGGGTWVALVQGMVERLVAQYKGVKVQCWLRCPHKGCNETLAYAKLQPSSGGGWEKVGKVWAAKNGTAMCGGVPVAHSFPTQVWIKGVQATHRGSPLAGGGSGSSSGYRDETVVEIVTRGASGASTVVTRGASGRGGGGAMEVSGGGGRASGALLAVAGPAMGYSDSWKTSALVHYGEYAAHNVETFSGFVVDPYTHKISEDNMAVLSAVGACFGGDEHIVGGILMEVDDWAPVCKGVLGLLGSVIVAVERGKSNEGNRKRFYTRLVALGRSLLDVRRVFVHAAPPQMDALLETLKRALSFIVSFDQRSWLMRALKSGSDKAQFDDLDRQLSQLCTDMSISLHATAYNDEHEALREVVDKLGGLERLQANPALLGRLETLCEAQRMQGAQQQQQLAAIQLLLQRDAQRGAPQVEKDAPHVERDAPQFERDAPQFERDAPQVERDAPQVERDAPQVERDAPQFERDAPQVAASLAEGSLCSHVPQMTAPAESPPPEACCHLVEDSSVASNVSCPTGDHAEVDKVDGTVGTGAAAHAGEQDGLDGSMDADPGPCLLSVGVGPMNLNKVFQAAAPGRPGQRYVVDEESDSDS